MPKTIRTAVGLPLIPVAGASAVTPANAVDPRAAPTPAVDPREHSAGARALPDAMDPGAKTVVGLRPPHASATHADSSDVGEMVKTRVGFQAPGHARGGGAAAEAASRATEAGSRTFIGMAAPGEGSAARAGGSTPPASLSMPPTLKDPSARQPAAPATLENGAAGLIAERPSRPPGDGERGARDSRGQGLRPSNENGTSDELGATIAPAPLQIQVSGRRMRAHALVIPKPVLPPDEKDAGRAQSAKGAKGAKGVKGAKGAKGAKDTPGQISRATVGIVGAAVVLALGAVIFAALWPGAPPITAHARTDAQGREIIELTCPSCPDETTLSIGQVSSKVSGKLATMQLAAPLPVGESTLKVRVDRPGTGRDETIAVRAAIAYRVRSDLSTLQGERPAIQVVIEAARGAKVTLDGRPIPLSLGKATETIDVTESCMGLTDEIKPLSLQIPYAVTSEDGQTERGTASVVVSIVPLALFAPGPNVIIDGPSFVLAGRTVKGAELFAAGKPIPVKPDGSFAHVMNVSSIGATQIEVRAKLAGMAPRLTRIKVRRVDSLETAARDFAAESPISYPVLATDAARQVGKPVVLAGEVIEARRENHQTIMLLDAGGSSGCKDCRVRLIQGADNPVQVGDVITVYGRVLRAPAAPGQAPDVQVDFTLKGAR